jgi:protein SCO1/2
MILSLRLLLLSLVLASPLALRAASCCAGESEEAAGGSYSSLSLYQTGARFTDDAGKPFSLGSLRGRPVVLVMFYANCRYACPLLLADVMRLRAELPESRRSSVAYVFVSLDSERDTPEALAAFRGSRQLGAEWYLLHGDTASVRELAALLGVKYVREADGGYSHSNLITLLDRQGAIAFQQTGLQAPVAPAARELNLLAAD